ncbi:MAG: hypothetical protein ACT4OP_11165 [Actinomycetota bacterium]
MIDILGLDTIFAEMVIGLGLALVVGNLLAWRKHRRGETPAGVQGQYRSGRVRFLLVVGLLMTLWGLGSLLSGQASTGWAGKLLW